MVASTSLMVSGELATSTLSRLPASEKNRPRVSRDCSFHSLSNTSISASTASVKLLPPESGPPVSGIVSIHSLRLLRARCRRLITVPAGTSRKAAISSYLSPRS